MTNPLDRLDELDSILRVGWSAGINAMEDGHQYFSIEYDLIGDDWEWYLDDSTFDEFLWYLKEVMESHQWN